MTRPLYLSKRGYKKLRKNTALKGYYGNTVLFKKFCPTCNSVSIMIDGKCSDCGKDLRLSETKKIISKRESTTDTVRHRPTRKLQKEILDHQNNQCPYCGGRFGRYNKVVWDHFIPFATGESGDSNWIGACSVCNSFKSSYLFDSMESAQIFLQNRRSERGYENYFYGGGSYEVRKV